MGNELVPTPKVSPIEYLHSMGYSFVSPVEEVGKRKMERMAEFNRYDWGTSDGRRAKAIAGAYYALELSTPLPPLDSALSALEKLDIDNREDADNIIKKLSIVWTVDSLLEQYYDYYGLAEDTYMPYLLALRKLKAGEVPITAENTGALKALSDMSRTTGKLGTITPPVSRVSEVLIRTAIAQEKGLELPDSIMRNNGV